jgi:hypothetical protein
MKLTTYLSAHTGLKNTQDYSTTPRLHSMVLQSRDNHLYLPKQRNIEWLLPHSDLAHTLHTHLLQLKTTAAKLIILQILDCMASNGYFLYFNKYSTYQHT